MGVIKTKKVFRDGGVIGVEKVNICRFLCFKIFYDFNEFCAKVLAAA